MAVYKTTNPEFGNIPTQTTQDKVPVPGELFRDDSGAIYYMDNDGGTRGFNPVDILPKPWSQFGNYGDQMKEANKRLGALNAKTYNSAAITSYLQKQGLPPLGNGGKLTSKEVTDFSKKSVSSTGTAKEFEKTESNIPGLAKIYGERKDLQELYDKETGKAKDTNDPRVAGIPTISDWWEQYGKEEYKTGKFVATTPRTSTTKPSGESYAEKTGLNPFTGEPITGGTTGTQAPAPQGEQEPDVAQLISDAISQYFPDGLEEAKYLSDAEIIAIIEQKYKDEKGVSLSFADIIKSEVEPYFTEKERVGAETYKRAFENLYTDRLPQVMAEGRRRQREMPADLASAGLTYGGQARETLGETAAGGLGETGLRQEAKAGERGLLGEEETQARSAFQRAAEFLGLRAEEMFGTQTAEGLRPTGYESGALGLRGEQDYSLIGDVRGELPYQREVAGETRRRELISGERGVQSDVLRNRYSSIFNI